MRFIFLLLVVAFPASAQYVSSGGSGQAAVSTVATMPVCNAAGEGILNRAVTDALAPVSLAIVTGGGAIHVHVYCNGTNWIVQ